MKKESLSERLYRCPHCGGRRAVTSVDMWGDHGANDYFSLRARFVWYCRSCPEMGMDNITVEGQEKSDELQALLYSGERR